MTGHTGYAVGKRVAILTFAGKSIGYGHVTRCRKIAGELSERGIEIRFLLIRAEGDEHATRLAERSAPVSSAPDSEGEIVKSLKRLDPAAILVDLQSRDLSFLRNISVPVVALDCYAPGADLYINVRHRPFDRRGAEERNGLRYWATTAPERVKAEIPDKVAKVLVTCGYTDPFGVLPHLLALVKSYHATRGENPEITCIVTSAHDGEIDDTLRSIHPDVRIVRDAESMEDELFAADIALTLGGSTTIEALLVGVPTIILPNSPANTKLAGELVALGLVRDGETAEEIRDGRSSRFEVSYEALQHAGERRRLSTAGRNLDASGVPRIADEVCNLMEKGR